jgi:hypothetical protein
VWSWQQALLAAGVDRQLKRGDLRPELRLKLKRAQTFLWKTIHQTNDWKNSELWTWTEKNGRMIPFPYGQGAGHHTASNADQLWSLVYLGLNDPLKNSSGASQQAQ